MSTVNFSVPEKIKKRFNEVFAHENKSHLIAEMMEKAIEEYEHRQQRSRAIDALLKLRSEQKPITTKKIQAARKRDRI